MVCVHKIRKVYRVRLFDSTINKVNFDNSQSSNTLRIRPDLLYKAIQYLQAGNEVIMRVMPSSISIENISTEEQVRTVTNLSVSDVDDISILAPTTLRFLTTVLS